MQLIKMQTKGFKMLIIYQPEDKVDSMAINIHDTMQNRTYYTDEEELAINLEGVASCLDDFVGLGKKRKSQLIIHNLTESASIEPLIKAFKSC